VNLRVIAQTVKMGMPVRFVARGHSMYPIIQDGQEVVIIPGNEYEVGEVVLARVKGMFYLHQIKAVNKEKGIYLIGNARGRINGWTRKVYGKVEL
jgi:SOS-response transcriptional repressor LexA